MSTLTEIPATIANAYTQVDGWTRERPWQVYGAHYVATYICATHGVHRVRVFVRRDYIKDATAAVFEITMQLQKATRIKRRRHDGQKHQTRAGRPSKRQRMEAQHG